MFGQVGAVVPQDFIVILFHRRFTSAYLMI